MGDVRQRGVGPGDERDELDLLIDGALDRMGGEEPVDVRPQVLARLDAQPGAVPAPWAAWAAWRPAAAVGAAALVLALAAVAVSRLTIDRGGGAPGSRSAAARTDPAARAPGPAREAATLVQAEPPRADAEPSVRRRRLLTDARQDASVGSAADMAESEQGPADALAGAWLTLPGAPAGNTAESILAMPAPPPVVIPAITPAPIVVIPTVGELGTPLGILPIAEPAKVVTNIEKSGGTRP